MSGEHGGSTTGRTLLVAAVLTAVLARPARAQAPAAPIDNPLQIPDLRQIAPPAKDGGGVTATLQIFVILTLLAFAPAILLMTTSFTRILIVMALLRQAMATQQLPPSQVMLGLSMFLTFAVMGPTWDRINREALGPYLNNQMTQRRALAIAGGHLREFMFDQIEKAENEEEIYMFLEYSRGSPIPPGDRIERRDIPTTALVPAFILSELKTAFVMGFRIYLPFLVIDMVIASILVSMGMMMLPPVLISLPFKILLFVLADGWHLVIGSLLVSFA